MKKKIGIAIIIIALILLGIVIARICLEKENEYVEPKVIADNENKYIITTDMKWGTMQNDGGSHTNTYYQIDFNENKVIKYQDKYVGFKGYEYQGKILYEKQLQEVELNELKTILDDAIEKVEEEQDNYDFYEISLSDNKSAKIYNKDTINKIENLLKDDNINLKYEIISKVPNEIKFDLETKGEEIIEYNDEYYVFIKMGECTTGGYDIKVDRIETKGKTANIYIKTFKPKNGEVVTMAFTYPYVVVKFNEKPNVNVIENNK